MWIESELQTRERYGVYCNEIVERGGFQLKRGYESDFDEKECRV